MPRMKGLPMLPPEVAEENRQNLERKLSTDATFRTMHGSAVGLVMKMMRSLEGSEGEVESADFRESVAEMLNEMLETTGQDKSAWSVVRGQMKYDEYLKMRERIGKVTALDLVRSGLQEYEFSTMLAYFDHYQRVMDHNKERAIKGLAVGKVCNKCGTEKPLSAFKRGAVCKACNSKAYRDRKAAKASEEES